MFQIISLIVPIFARMQNAMELIIRILRITNFFLILRIKLKKLTLQERRRKYGLSLGEKANNP